MAGRAVDADLDTQNRASYAARDRQTLGEPAMGQGAVRALPASSHAVPRTVGVVILTAAVVIGGLYLLLVLAGLFISPFNSLVLLIYFMVYQQVENYLLQPLVYSQRVQLHPLTIFIAVVLGGVWLGVAGAFLAIPAAEIIRIVGAEWLASRAEQNHAVPAGTRHGSDVKIDQ